MNRTGWLIDLGRMEYAEAWAWQRHAAHGVRTGRHPEVLFLVEHPPVYTVGRGARGSLENLLWDEATRRAAGIGLFEVDRGGDITYHGPGQLVAYPIVDLKTRGRDLHRYLRSLEEAIIRALAAFGVTAQRLPPHTGVWVEEEKVAAIGVKASHWVTQHGLALNVCPNLAHFAGIIPCGIRDRGVTSLERLLGRPVSVEVVKPHLVAALEAVLETHWETQALDVLGPRPVEAGA
ncbi:MAG: lipoyl(octanoyl) transferase LipB [Firmicutes bacterium]|nr:lipoyl(octanoyl) transferase LipB [Alicyclobacillaceae bacterium]MCL6496171.1 lipoyl(octanoyl) transferase LipB [Bacillota bacterium]